MRKLREQKGFTLIEVVVALILVALAAALVAPDVLQNLGKGNRKAAQAQIALFESTLDNYRLDVGRYPTTSEGLNALRNRPSGNDGQKWEGPYIRKDVPLDPWKNEYQYLNPGKNNPSGVDIWSWGADGREGGEGENADIGNW